MAKKAKKKTTTKKATAKKKVVVKKKATAKKKVIVKKKAAAKKKKVSPLSAREIGHFRELLLQKRREIMGDVSSIESGALKKSRMDDAGDLSSMPIHMADMGTDNFEQEFALGLMDSERKLLREINAALGRIVDGGYGICEGTSKEIGKARLEANPWARYCIEYATMVEKGLIIEGEKIFEEEEDEEPDDVVDDDDDDEIDEDEERDRALDILNYVNGDDDDEEEEEKL